MLVSSVLGAIVGARIVSRLPVNTLRKILAVILPCVAVILICKLNGFGPFGMMGEEIGLTGGKGWL